MDTAFQHHKDKHIRAAFFQTRTTAGEARCNQRGDILICESLDTNRKIWLSAHYQLSPAPSSNAQLWFVVNSPSSLTYIDEEVEKKLTENNCFLSTEDCANVMRAVRNCERDKEMFYLDMSILLYKLSVSEQPVHLVFLQPLEPPFYRLLLEIIETLSHNITLTLRD